MYLLHSVLYFKAEKIKKSHFKGAITIPCRLFLNKLQLHSYHKKKQQKSTNLNIGIIPVAHKAPSSVFYFVVVCNAIAIIYVSPNYCTTNLHPSPALHLIQSENIPSWTMLFMLWLGGMCKAFYPLLNWYWAWSSNQWRLIRWEQYR